MLQKLTESYKNELKHLFQCCILIPRKCPAKPHFNTQWEGPKKQKSAYVTYEWSPKYVGDYVKDHEPDVIVMATPHGINLSESIGIYAR